MYGILTSVKVGAVSELQWTSGAPTVLKNVVTTVLPNVSCGVPTTVSYIRELKGTREVCISSDSGFGIGNIDYNGSSQPVVMLPYSNEVHSLHGVCNGMRCQYIAATDSLVTLQSVRPSVYGIVIYKHASERVHRTTTNGEQGFDFDISNPEFELKDTAGQYLLTPTFTVSHNGKWIVAELYSRGLVLIHADTFETRQITNEGYGYGYGYNPSLQTAVSDDGIAVAVGGTNVGFKVFDVTADCGRSPIDDGSNQVGMTNCPSTNLGVQSLFPNFQEVSRVRFVGGSKELEVYVSSWVQPAHRVTYLVAGATPAHQLKILSLGDSFTSGEGETDASFYTPEPIISAAPCHVSSRAYPTLIGVRLGVPSADMKNIACAGAQIGDIVGAQSLYWGQGERLGENGLRLTADQKVKAQDTALESFLSGESLQSEFIERYTPNLITIGIGGNDAGLMGKLRVCAAPGTCEWAQGDGVVKTYAEIARLYEKLGKVLGKVRTIAPDSQVLVVGYPNVIDPNGKCDVLTNTLLNQVERQYMKNSIGYLNEVIHAAADRAGYLYVDIQDVYADKTLCGEATPKAMNGVRFGDDISLIDTMPLTKIIGSETFHPTPTGHELAAQAIVAQYPDVLNRPIAEVNLGVEPPGYVGMENEKNSTQSYMSEFAQKSSSRSMKIELAAGSLEPGTTATVEIHSDSAVLGKFVAGSDGSIKSSVEMPGSVSDGYHTLHLVAQNRSGDTIDMYQFVTIGEDKEAIDTDEVIHDAASRVLNVPGITRHVAVTPFLAKGDAGLVDDAIFASADVLGMNTIKNPIKTNSFTRDTSGVDENVHKLSTMLILWIGIGVSLVVVFVIFLLKRWAKQMT